MQEPTLSPIEKRRRQQIIEATISRLAAEGYIHTSLADIAQQANISVGLIAYHFKNKDELMQQTVLAIMQGWYAYVEKALHECSTPTEQLEMYVRANLAYMLPRLSQFQALMEIIFNARDSKGGLQHQSDQDDPGIMYIKNILDRGQACGEFRQFPSYTAALAIRATIDQFLGQRPLRPDIDAEQYQAQLVDLVKHMVMANKPEP